MFLIVAMSGSRTSTPADDTQSGRRAATGTAPSTLNATAPGVVATNPHSVVNFTLNASDDYDDVGATSYVVVVMVVYAIVMFVLLGSVVKRKPHDRQLDVEIRNYKRGLDDARRRARQQSVLRTRLSYPGNFIGLRFSARHPCGFASPIDGMTSAEREDGAAARPLAMSSIEADTESEEDSRIIWRCSGVRGTADRGSSESVASVTVELPAITSVVE